MESMERDTGIGPVHLSWQGSVIPLDQSRNGAPGVNRTRLFWFVAKSPHPEAGAKKLERHTGVKPVSAGWKPTAQSLYQCRSP